MPKAGAKDSKEKKWKDKEEKKKREKQINDHKKEIQKLDPERRHLPYRLGIAIKNYTRRCYVDKESGVSKIWRVAPSGCSSSLQSHLLAVLPRQEINTTRRIHLSKTDYSVYVEFDDDSECGFTLHPSTSLVDYYWIFQRGCTIVGPKSSSYEQFRLTNAIACGGKFYALSSQGTLAVIDLEDPPVPQFRAVISIPAGIKRAIPSTCSSKGFREYLAELDGEILLVLLVSRRSMNVVDDVEVFRLDLTNTVGWVKIESLGDRTMFVGGKYCSTFRASELIRFEFAKNSIYFNLQTGTGWWVFDVGGRSISPAQV